MSHDFKKYPELTNTQMQFYLFDSPFPQITEDFDARISEVHDGDTVKVKADFRDFNFPIRMSNIAAPEIKETGGIQSRDWLRSKILGKEVTIIIDEKNRVGKYGRLIGEIIYGGENINEASLREGQSIDFSQGSDGLIPSMRNTIQEIGSLFK